ncbi:MAG: hypothetical protein WC651_04235 [Candidatus Gracilibacteria bacterium]|jgi:hypothetical protein
MPNEKPEAPDLFFPGAPATPRTPRTPTTPRTPAAPSHTVLLSGINSAIKATLNPETPETALLANSETVGNHLRNLPEKDFREFAGKLLELRINTLIDNKEPKNPPPKNRVKAELIPFLSAHKSQALREMAPHMAARISLIENSAEVTQAPLEFIENMILLSRLYHLRGINMVNPGSDPLRINSLPLKEGRAYIINLPGKEHVQITINQGNTVITAQNGYRAILQENIVYIIGRVSAHSLPIKHSDKTFDQIWPPETAQILPGFGINTQISRGGIGLEVKQERLSIYDRVSKNSFSFQETELPQDQESIPGATKDIGSYHSAVMRNHLGDSVLGSAKWDKIEENPNN